MLKLFSKISLPLRRHPWWVEATLVLWVASVLWFMISSPPPPEVPHETEKDRKIRIRENKLIVDTVKKWRDEEGDKTIAWEKAEGHLAILIDDLGRELRWQKKLQSLPYQLTFSVLPGSVYTEGARRRLQEDRRRYRETFLHLPMESLAPEPMREGAEVQEDFLLSTDKPEDLRRKFEAALQKVPSAVGVNNHMGSKLTSNRQAMEVLMEELAKRKLVFVDSRTHASTVALDVAREKGVVANARSFFLDHEPNPISIARTLEQAATQALQQPTIVIAHPTAAVFEVLEEQLPRLYKQGIAIYPVTEVLVRNRAENAVESNTEQELDDANRSNQRAEPGK